MAGVPGKNKIERGFRILVDNSAGSAQDLSGDLVPGSCKGGGVVLDEIEMTGVSNTVKNYLGGFGDAPIDAQFYMNDTATTGAFTVLKGITGLVGTVTLQWGSNGAAPSTGDPEWEGEYTCLAADLGMNGGKAVINAKFKPGSAVAPAWGTVA
jgi:hypothetical protein